MVDGGNGSGGGGAAATVAIGSFLPPQHFCGNPLDRHSDLLKRFQATFSADSEVSLIVVCGRDVVVRPIGPDSAPGVHQDLQALLLRSDDPELDLQGEQLLLRWTPSACARVFLWRVRAHVARAAATGRRRRAVESSAVVALCRSAQSTARSCARGVVHMRCRPSPPSPRAVCCDHTQATARRPSRCRCTCWGWTCRSAGRLRSTSRQRATCSWWAVCLMGGGEVWFAGGLRAGEVPAGEVPAPGAAH
jgi:hypothetical protein